MNRNNIPHFFTLRCPGNRAGISSFSFTGFKKSQLYLSLTAAFLSAFLALYIADARACQEAAAESAAPYVLRFHVLANSDSKTDQALKLQVRDLLLTEIRDGFSRLEKGSRSGLLCPVSEPEYAEAKKAELQSYILLHQTELETAADSFIKEQGFPYRTKISLESAYFPTRLYGDTVFPCGIYDAVRVVIGTGEGHNWWCVLYPSLCFTRESVSPAFQTGSFHSLLEDDELWNFAQDSTLVFDESLALSQTASPSSGENGHGGENSAAPKKQKSPGKPAVRAGLLFPKLFQ